MRRLAVLAVAVAGLIVPAAASATPNRPQAIRASGSTVFYSNQFVSPSGNIHCRYFPSSEAVGCKTLNTGLVVFAPRYGTGYSLYSGSMGGGPTLPYGTYYSVPGIRCDSYFSGMQCRTSAGHGFFVNRTDYSVW